MAPGAKKVGIIDDADAFLSMLGGANFNHNSIRDLTSTNNSTREKILSYIESLSASKSNGENIGDLVNKLVEEVQTENGKTTKKYKPNSTICGSCEGDPHGLPKDFIIDEKGNVKDTIKNTKKK